MRIFKIYLVLFLLTNYVHGAEANNYTSDECVVCLDVYDDDFQNSCVLNCGHNLCQSCLAKIISLHAEASTCPQCRAHISQILIADEYVDIGSYSLQYVARYVTESFDFLSLIFLVGR